MEKQHECVSLIFMLTNKGFSILNSTLHKKINFKFRGKEVSVLLCFHFSKEILVNTCTCVLQGEGTSTGNVS